MDALLIWLLFRPFGTPMGIEPSPVSGEPARDILAALNQSKRIWRSCAHARPFAKLK
jgi:hypothetical protein